MNQEILKLIPHRQSLVLIDEVLDTSKNNFTVLVKVSKKSLLATKKGVPGFCGIEYMAQSIAAYNNTHFNLEDKPKLGFVIAIRGFESELNFFPLGSRLEVFIEPNLIFQNSSGSFKGEIKIDNKIVAKATITAYVPSDEELAGFKSEANLIAQKDRNEIK
jgi:predicted hotdog family 3-hydroxylacyl-ACP dehydratase